MAINYDFYKTDGSFSGEKEQWYVRPVENGTVESEEIFRQIERASTFSVSDMKGALSALVSTISRELREGRRVHIKGLGHFSIAITGDVVTDEEGRPRLNNPAIRDIHFRPDDDLMADFHTAGFTSRNHYGRHSAKVDEADIEAALEQLAAEKGHFTTDEFRHHLHLTRATAGRILLNLCRNGRIENFGSRRYALYRPVK